jgi:hypothetical protein
MAEGSSLAGYELQDATHAHASSSPAPSSHSINLPLFSAELADNPADRPQDLIPFPGLGRLRKDGNGYIWAPVVFTDQWAER